MIPVVMEMAALAHGFYFVIITAFRLMGQVRCCQHNFRSCTVGWLAVFVRAASSMCTASTLTMTFAAAFRSFKTYVVAKLFPVRAVAMAVFRSYRHRYAAIARSRSASASLLTSSSTRRSAAAMRCSISHASLISASSGASRVGTDNTESRIMRPMV